MQTAISLNNVIESTQLIFKYFDPPSTVLIPWINAVDLVLPETIRKDQIERAIASSRRKRFNEELNVSKESLALMYLMMHYAEKEFEWKILERLKSIISEHDDRITDEAKQLFKKLLVHIDGYKYRTTIRIKPNLFPLLLDQVLRWTVLGYCATQGFLRAPIFYLLQIGVIPVLTLAVTYWYYLAINRKNKELIEELALLERVKLKLVGLPHYYFLLVSIAAIGGVTGFFVFPEDPENESLVLLIALFLVWIVFLSIFHQMSHSRLTEREVRSQLSSSIDFSETLDVDQNDEVIVTLKERLRSIASRLDAYILESALFGALAFSGFLQIMAENLVTFESLESFANNSIRLINGVVFFDPTLIDLSFLNDNTALFSLISVETLVCSMLFLGVIAARLRFSNVADNVRLHIEAASAFNSKEETMIHLDHLKPNDPNLFSINRKIHEELNKANNLLSTIGPVTSFMKFFRNGGIITFLIILISSALLISDYLFFAFILFSIATGIYFNRKWILEGLLSIRYRVQYLALNYSIFIILLSLGLLIIATVLAAYFQWPHYDLVLTFAGFLFIIYRLVSIFWLPFYDPSFTKEVQPSRATKIVWGIGETFLILGFLRYFLYLEGAALLLLLGTLMFAFSMLLLGVKFSTNRLMGVVLALASGSAIISILFLTLRMVGTSWFFYTALALSLIVFVYYLINKTKIHRQVIVILLGTILLSFYCFSLNLRHRLMLHLQTADSGIIQPIVTSLNILYFFEAFDEQDSFDIVIETGQLIIDVDKGTIKANYASNLVANIYVVTEFDKGNSEIAKRENLLKMLRLAEKLDPDIEDNEYDEVKKFLGVE